MHARIDSAIFKQMLPAKYREVRKYLRVDVDVSLVEEAARRCGMRSVEGSTNDVVLSTPLSFWSFGEDIQILLGKVEGHSIVDATSKCRFQFQIGDWGKNERNVRRLFRALSESLGEDGDYENCAICRQCGYVLLGLESNRCPECGRIGSNKKVGWAAVSATWRSALWYGVCITAFELFFIVGIEVLGMGNIVPQIVRGIRGGIYLLCLNTVSLLGVVAAHRSFARVSKDADHLTGAEDDSDVAG